VLEFLLIPSHIHKRNLSRKIVQVPGTCKIENNGVKIAIDFTIYIHEKKLTAKNCSRIIQEP
jgi:hypothetical protein